MPRTPSFNFGANKKARKPKKPRATKPRSGTGRGSKSNAWRAYISNAPIPE